MDTFLITLGILVALGYGVYRILQIKLDTGLAPRIMRQLERDVGMHDAPRRQPDDIFAMLHEATRDPRHRPTIIDAEFEEIRPVAPEMLKCTTRRIGTPSPLRRHR
jgi:hypothetical protein